MSDELIKELKERIRELKVELDATKGESIARRGKLADAKKAKAESDARIAELQAERDKVLTDAAAAAADRDQWKAKADATPGELGLKVQELEGQIRTRDHRDEWSKLVGAELADKATVADVWDKLKYTPGEALPTPEEIREQVGRARDAAPYLFRAPAATAGGATDVAKDGTKPALRVAESHSRGARDSASGSVSYRESDLRQPGWMTKNPALAAAIADRSAVLLPE